MLGFVSWVNFIIIKVINVSINIADKFAESRNFSGLPEKILHWQGMHRLREEAVERLFEPENLVIEDEDVLEPISLMTYARNESRGDYPAGKRPYAIYYTNSNNLILHWKLRTQKKDGSIESFILQQVDV